MIPDTGAMKTQRELLDESKGSQNDYQGICEEWQETGWEMGEWHEAEGHRFDRWAAVHQPSYLTVWRPRAPHWAQDRWVKGLTSVSGME